jgi:hypothetical protein
MNSNQDNKSGVIYNRLLAGLQQDSVAPPERGQAQGQTQGTTSTNHTAATPPTGDAIAADDLAMDELDPLDSEEWNFLSEGFDEANPDYQTLTDGYNPDMSPTTTDTSYKPGPLGVNIPTVQNRFQALLKRRLQAEIECHPPRFPWETEIYQYDPDNSDDLADSWVPPFSLWTAHLQNFSLLGSLPETVLAQLLETCTQVVQYQVQMGVQLVRAVLPFFPDKSQSLNNYARLVLLGVVRSDQQLISTRYETATTDQKMALSLLAAREIFKALNLTVWPNQPPVEQQWQTQSGLLTLQVEYQTQGSVPKLRVQCRLPKGGSLKLRTGLYEATAERIYPGHLSVESYDVPPNQTYFLEVRFQFQEKAPLVFAIHIAGSN